MTTGVMAYVILEILERWDRWDEDRREEFRDHLLEEVFHAPADVREWMIQTGLELEANESPKTPDDKPTL